MKTKTNEQTKTKKNRDTQRPATHLSTFTLYQLLGDKDEWTDKDKQTGKDKQISRGLIHTCQLTLCNKDLDKQRHTKVCYTPINFHSVPVT